MYTRVAASAVMPVGESNRALRLVPWSRSAHSAANRHTYVVSGDVAGAPLDRIDLPPDYPDVPQLTRPLSLKVLHLNDLHGHITRLSPYGTQPVLSRVAWYVKRLHQMATTVNSSVLLLSAGDDMSGSIFDTLRQPPNGNGTIHPTYRAYSALGLGAATVGNHDLDSGADYLAGAIRADASFPVLSANVAGSDILDTVFPAAVIVLNGVRIGVIGLTTPQQHKHTGQLHFVHPQIALDRLLPILCPICDVVILLSHLGHRAGEGHGHVHPVGDAEIAAALSPDQVHLIIGGHSHSALNEEGLEPANIVGGVPIVQAGAHGRFLGEVTILLEPRAARHDPPGPGAQTVAVSVMDACLIPVSDLPVDPDYEATVVQPLLNMVTPSLRRVIGRCDNVPGMATEALHAHYDRGESALANYVTDALYERCHANGMPVDLAMIDASILRRGVPVGAPLTVGDWHQVMPYTDTIQLYSVTGQTLLALLFDNALRLGRPGEPRTERGFVQFSRHVRYGIDLGATRWDNRATRALIGGHGLLRMQRHRFIVATHSHFRQSAAAWERRSGIELHSVPQWLKHETPQPTDLLLRDELLVYIEDNGGILATSGARCDGRVRVLPTHIDYEHSRLLDQSVVS